MQTENILDENNPEKQQFTKCKIKYLKIQNHLMSIQLTAISMLIEKYKKIIDILSIDNWNDKAKEEDNREELGQGEEKQIKVLLGEAQKIIQNCINSCRQFDHHTNIHDEEQIKISPPFFTALVLSYQKTIATLKQSIHHRQMLLQEIQKNGKGSPKKYDQYEDHLSIIKVIESYDIYPKLAEKCKKEIIELREKKKLFNSSSPIPNDTKSKYHINGDNQAIKSPKNISQNLPTISVPPITTIPDELISPFEKTVLIYKKKKILNDILQSKVYELKKKIKEKEACNLVLKKNIQNQVWYHLDDINYLKYYHIEDQQSISMSILNQSMKTNHLNFSVDLSRIVGESQQTKQDTRSNIENILENVEQKNNITEIS